MKKFPIYSFNEIEISDIINESCHYLKALGERELYECELGKPQMKAFTFKTSRYFPQSVNLRGASPVAQW